MFVRVGRSSGGSAASPIKRFGQRFVTSNAPAAPLNGAAKRFPPEHADVASIHGHSCDPFFAAYLAHPVALSILLSFSSTPNDRRLAYEIFRIAGPETGDGKQVAGEAQRA
jgi:hypothetical protein